MDNQNLTWIERGKIHSMLKETDIEWLEWQPHPSFQGVHMKHLIRAEDTEGRFSVHLVRVLAGFSLENHTHDGRWELHEVMAGRGTACIEEKTVTYEPLTLAVIPADAVHRVDAEENLVILAKFIPGLL